MEKIQKRIWFAVGGVHLLGCVLALMAWLSWETDFGLQTGIAAIITLVTAWTLGVIVRQYPVTWGTIVATTAAATTLLCGFVLWRTWATPRAPLFLTITLIAIVVYLCATDSERE